MAPSNFYTTARQALPPCEVASSQGGRRRNGYDGSSQRDTAIRSDALISRASPEAEHGRTLRSIRRVSLPLRQPLGMCPRRSQWASGASQRCAGATRSGRVAALSLGDGHAPPEDE